MLGRRVRIDRIKAGDVDITAYRVDGGIDGAVTRIYYSEFRNARQHFGELEAGGGIAGHGEPAKVAALSLEALEQGHQQLVGRVPCLRASVECKRCGSDMPNKRDHRSSNACASWVCRVGNALASREAIVPTMG